MIKTPKGTPVWALEAALGIVLLGAMLFGGAWWTSANDTLKTAATLPEVRELITASIAPDKVKLENVDTTLKELKQDFKEWKSDQKQEFQSFKDKQDRMMEILLRMDGNRPDSNGGRR